MDLEIIAKLLENKNLSEKERILVLAGRIQHIAFETGKSSELIKEDPQRFINVGSKTLNREDCKSEEDYKEACISNAAFLYERSPLIFEFYDELMNGIAQKKEMPQKQKKLNLN